MVEIAELGKYDNEILGLLSDEPKTPNEIAEKLGIHQKTAQTTLMQLALSRPEAIGYKRVGRTHLFWLKEMQKKD
jgi:DNA-binding CsgD family transcriptional regulator